MIKIFVANKTDYPNSTALIQSILQEKFGEKNYQICKTEHGKPYLKGVERKSAKYLSVSHTKEKYFIAFSPFEIGIDAEDLSREVNYSTVLKKFNETERAKVQNVSDFLAIWTAKESVVKYLGSTLSKDLKNIAVDNGCVTFCEEKLPVRIKHFQKFGHILSVCLERETSVQFERL